MDLLWWVVGLAVLAMVVVLVARSWGRSRAPSEDPAAERAAQQRARLEQEGRDQVGPGEGSV